MVPQYDNLITFNEHGFRDAPRIMAKPISVSRVAVLGDSLVEAVQVSLEKTAASLLEQDLNLHGNSTLPGKWEVLNFGVSNYGLGQFYLNWVQNASRFHPDYVFVLIGGFHLHRTLNPSEGAGLSVGGPALLEVRPTFTLKGGRIEAHPPRDFLKFKEAQQSVINDQWGGSRVHPVPPRGFYMLDLKMRLFLGNGPLLRIQRKIRAEDLDRGRTFKIWPDFTEEGVQLNMAILDEMVTSVRRAGAKFVIVDVHEYAHQNDTAIMSDPLSKGLSTRLQSFAIAHETGYINLSRSLLDANRRGRSTAWIWDGHFNKLGNRIFAEAMRDWLSAHAHNH